MKFTQAIKLVFNFAFRLMIYLGVKGGGRVLDERLAVVQVDGDGHITQDLLSLVLGHQERFGDGLRVDAW